MLRGLADESLRVSLPACYLSGLLMMQHGFAFIAFAGAYIGFYSLQRHDFSWRSLFLRLLSVGSGVTVVLACLFLIMAWNGVFSSFWFWTVDYAYSYISQVSPEKALRALVQYATPILKSAPLIWLAIGIALFAVVKKRGETHRRFFLIM
jgi:hypothetical protein